MDAFNPAKLATWWVGMALGIPMLATELAAEVWGTRPKPAPVPAEKAAGGMTRTVEDIQTRFSTEGLDDVQAAFAGDWSQDPIVLTPGRIEELPPGFVVHPARPGGIEIEAQTGPLPMPKPRKRKS